MRGGPGARAVTGHVLVGVIRPATAPVPTALEVPGNAGPFPPEHLSPLLDGADVECAFRIPLDPGTFLTGWCDESGHPKGLPFNFLRWRADGDPIVGPVVLTREGRDEDGWLIGLRDGDLARIAFVTPLQGGAAAGPRVLVVPNVR